MQFTQDIVASLAGSLTGTLLRKHQSLARGVICFISGAFSAFYLGGALIEWWGMEQSPKLSAAVSYVCGLATYGIVLALIGYFDSDSRRLIKGVVMRAVGIPEKPDAPSSQPPAKPE